MSHRAILATASVILSLAALAGAVLAEPLAKEECEKLGAEHTALVAAGVREQLERGAEWGKANLSPPDLLKVQRFIHLEEQLSFRCGLAKLRASLPQTDENGDQDDEEKTNGVDAKAKPPLPVRPAPRATQDKAGAQPKPKPAARPAPKPRAKVDDAYRPPPAKAGADPFATKVLPAQGRQ